MPIGLIILAAFILVPTIEIYLFIQVGSAIGALPTILLTVASAVAGTALLRYQGLSLLMKMRKELDAGRVPNEEIMHGAMIVVAGIMLLIPGFFTDSIGLILFIPPVRSAIGRYLAANMTIKNVNVDGYSRPRNRDGVVDLDEDDWQSSRHNQEDDETTSKQNTGGTDRISPWRNE
ncbi:FxsA family protein [Flexibacterium corallicola]|uniref:FxsA family protein n=1 Tax=Flexibacterium corallicola TaxID=3037259 RepID=UPI00286F72B6|nr:FxsA family protein [Pseudovibrio sp. M1P-2-3]